jgi:hypothetical protein
MVEPALSFRSSPRAMLRGDSEGVSHGQPADRTHQAAAKAMKQFGRGGAIVQTGSMWGLQAIYPYNSN